MKSESFATPLVVLLLVIFSVTLLRAPSKKESLEPNQHPVTIDEMMVIYQTGYDIGKKHAYQYPIYYQDSVRYNHLMDVYFTLKKAEAEKKSN